MDSNLSTLNEAEKIVSSFFREALNKQVFFVHDTGNRTLIFTDEHETTPPQFVLYDDESCDIKIIAFTFTTNKPIFEVEQSIHGKGGDGRVIDYYTPEQLLCELSETKKNNVSKETISFIKKIFFNWRTKNHGRA